MTNARQGFSLKVVLIGDVGWKHFYHLGDEAMMQVAIEQLRKHSTEITVVAAQPAVTSAMYRVRSVPRIGFSKSWELASLDGRLEGIVEEASRNASNEGTMFHALAEADLAIIAGGGNLNSLYYQHVYERVAFARIANAFRVPLVVTGQTVGPDLKHREKAMIQEIVSYARIFGVREQGSYKLLEALGCDMSKVVSSLDDGFLLNQPSNLPNKNDAFELPERYIVASFTSDPGDTGLGLDEYYAQIAGMLDHLAEAFNCDLVLIPHVGSFEENRLAHDTKSDAAIVGESASGRVTALPMLTASEHLHVVRGALCSISTRYHPLVFAPLVGVPAIGIALSHYSIVRMRGALANVGFQQLVVTFAGLHLIGDAIREVLDRRHEVVEYYTLSVMRGKKFLNSWWESIVSLTVDDSHLSFELPEAFVFRGDWAIKAKEIEPLFLQLCSSRKQNRSLSSEIVATERLIRRQTLQHKEVLQEAHNLKEQVVSVQIRAQRAENRKVIRAVDWIASISRLWRRNQ